MSPQPSFPPDVIAACDESILDELFEAFWLIESYARSAQEAAKRGDLGEVRLRLRCQMRDVFRHAVTLHDLLGPRPPKDGAGS